jgi:hypothetical protein
MTTCASSQRHVIEAARPVDGAADDFARFQRAAHDVRDSAVVAIDHVGHRRAAERAGIEGLAAGGWIKRRLIEHHVQAAVGRLDGDDRRIKRLAVRLGVIQALGHTSSRCGGTMGSSK